MPEGRPVPVWALDETGAFAEMAGGCVDDIGGPWDVVERDGCAAGERQKIGDRSIISWPEPSSSMACAAW